MQYGGIFYWLSMVAFVLQVPFVFEKKPEEAFALLVILGFGFLGSKFIRSTADKQDIPFELGAFLLAFSLRLWAGYLLYGYGLVNIVKDEDASGYYGGWIQAERWGREGIETIFSDMFSALTSRYNIGQHIVWGLILYVIDVPSRLAVSATNSFCGAMTAIAIYRLTHALFDRKSATLATTYIVFWPSLILLSASTAKEPLVIFLEWTFLCIAVQMKDKTNLRNAFVCMVILLVLYTLRFYAFYICTASFVALLFPFGHKSFLKSIFIGLILLASLLVIVHLQGILDRDAQMLDRLATIEDWRRNVASSTGSGILVYEKFEGSITGRILATPLALAYFLFSPFPWDIGKGSLRKNLVIPENIFYMWMFITCFLPGLRYVLKQQLTKIRLLIAFTVLHIAFQLLILSNIGVAWRHRQAVMPFFFMVAALELARKKSHQAESSGFGKSGTRARLARPFGRVPLPLARGAKVGPSQWAVGRQRGWRN